jgi:selenide,water dikinase
MDAGRIDTSAGRFEADYFVWATGASAPPWLAAGGIETDAGGFVTVNAMLQSVSHPDILAAGDVASMVGQRIPKSGVYAVRQGPFLAENVQQRLRAGTLRPYAPQSITLALISTGDRHAVASYARFAFEGAWVWRWKDRIDRRFMQRYRAASQRDDGGGRRA